MREYILLIIIMIVFSLIMGYVFKLTDTGKVIDENTSTLWIDIVLFLIFTGMAITRAISAWNKIF